MLLVDIINKIYNRLFIVRNDIYVSIASPIILMLLRMRGVKISKCKFYGKAFFYRSNNTNIYIGKNCTFRNVTVSNQIGINHKCIFSTQQEGARLNVGENCGFSGTTIGCFNEISIGNNVRCGANTLITDSDWHLDDPRTGKSEPVYIGDNVWLGYGVIVMKGVSIGENSVIGLNSVVTSNIPANSIAAGVPCKVLKKINESTLDY